MKKSTSNEIERLSWDKMKEKHLNQGEYKFWNKNRDFLQGEYSFKVDFIAWGKASGRKAGIHLFISVGSLKLRVFIYFNEQSYNKYWNKGDDYQGLFGQKKFEWLR